jgi:hypothetical protein
VTETFAWTPNGTTSTPRYVAVLDILGFKRRLETLGLTKVFADYEHLRRVSLLAARIANIGTVSGRVRKVTVNVPHVFLSDAVIAWCDDGPYIDDFLTGCCAIAAEALKLRIPLRGGIAFGKTIIDLGSLTFLGQPFVDAYLTEESQEWVGVAIHPTALNGLAGREDVKRRDVPTKRSACQPAWGLPGWTRRMLPRSLLRTPLTHALAWHHYLLGDEALEILGDLRRAAPKKDHAKYAHAADFVRALPLSPP